MRDGGLNFPLGRTGGWMGVESNLLMFLSVVLSEMTLSWRWRGQSV